MRGGDVCGGEREGDVGKLVVGLYDGGGEEGRLRDEARGFDDGIGGDGEVGQAVAEFVEGGLVVIAAAVEGDVVADGEGLSGREGEGGGGGGVGGLHAGNGVDPEAHDVGGAVVDAYDDEVGGAGSGSERGLGEGLAAA